MIYSSLETSSELCSANLPGISDGMFINFHIKKIISCLIDLKIPYPYGGGLHLHFKYESKYESEA